MHFTRIARLVLPAVAVCVASIARADDQPKQFRAGIIGLDTSHVIAFTDLINGKDAGPDISIMKVVVAYPGGSEDLPRSVKGVAEYVPKLRSKGIEIVDTIPALLEKCDVVLLESVDGRKHLEQARPVFEAKKPVFIDKPMAASLADGIAIRELAKKNGDVPWFSASSLRFSPNFAALAHDKDKVGDVVGCDAWSPCSLDSTHPDFFWYGIHGCEMLFTIMGPGCETVSRTHEKGTDFAVGTWKGGRIGTFRGLREGREDYGVTVFGSKGIVPAAGYGGYKPLVVEIAKFFKTHQAPVTPEQTIEILAFMEAADQSKMEGGKPVTIESVMKRAHEKLAAAAK